MIIQCENCSRKFQVKDEDIPKEGRMVQCSNCSQKWFQTPVKIKRSDTTDKDNVLTLNKQVKSNKSKILVLDQMIE